MDLARTSLPGALDTMIYMELSNALNEFFKQTNAWQITAPFTTQSGVSRYTLSSYCSSEIIRLMGVVNSDGIACDATMGEPGEVLLATTPTAGVSMVATFAVASEITNQEPDIPEWVLSKYFTEILDGLLGRMKAQIAKPYSSPQTAVIHLRRFRQGISSARVHENRQSTHRAQRWRFPKTFA
jgi:hypothetical protein